MIDEITPIELQERLKQDPNQIQILDVREPHEYDICHINGKLIPLGELPQRFQELDPNKFTVAHCRSGGRSAKATAFLKENGFKEVFNLKGGITAWIDQVDPSLTKY